MSGESYQSDSFSPTRMKHIPDEINTSPLSITFFPANTTRQQSAGKESIQCPLHDRNFVILLDLSSSRITCWKIKLSRTLKAYILKINDTLF